MPHVSPSSGTLGREALYKAAAVMPKALFPILLEATILHKIVDTSFLPSSSCAGAYLEASTDAPGAHQYS